MKVINVNIIAGNKVVLDKLNEVKAIRIDQAKDIKPIASGLLPTPDPIEQDYKMQVSGGKNGATFEHETLPGGSKSLTSREFGVFWWDSADLAWSYLNGMELPSAISPVQGVSVNGVEVVPDENGVISITTPDAPVQGVSVNGVEVVPDENGVISITTPDAPVQGVSVNGVEVVPDENGVISITTPDAPIQGVSVNGVSIEPDNRGQVDINLINVVDEVFDSGSMNPIANSVVTEEFTRLNSEMPASLLLNEIGEDEDKRYSISLVGKYGEILSTTPDLPAGGSGGNDSGSSRVILTKITENPIVKVGDDVRLHYYFDHKDASGQSTGLPGKAIITIISGVNSKTIERQLSPDSNNYIDVSDDVQVGDSTVRIKVEVDNDGILQSTTVQWRVRVVTLRLTSSLDYATLYQKGQVLSIPYTLSGSGVKALRLYLDGVQIDERSITTATSNGAFLVNLNVGHGKHSIQMVAILEVSATSTLRSNSIYFDIAVVEPNNNTPIITTRFDYSDGSIIGSNELPFIDIVQYSDYKISYAGYNPTANQNTISVVVDGIEISSIVSPFVSREATGRMLISGLYSGFIKLNNTQYNFGLRVNQADVNIEEPVDQLVFKLSATGRSNNDTNKNSWTYGNINTTITGVQYAGDGWVNGALRLTNGGKAIVNYQPLNLANAPARRNAFTFQCKIKISEVTDTEAAVLSCMSEGIGFKITSEEVSITTSASSQISMKFAPDQEYNIAFVSLPTAVPATSSDYEIRNDQMVLLYINGQQSGVVQRGVGDNIYQTTSPSNIIIEGTGATVDIYNMRCYNTYLNPDQVIDIRTLDMNSVDEMLALYEFNNVIDSEGDVTVDSLPDGTRYVVITGQQANGMDTVHYAAAINNKDNRYDVDEILHIVKGEDKRLNFKCVGGCIRLQGTSSLAYPIKNYRFYFRSATSGSRFGEVYLGVDAQGLGGELIEGTPKFSFKLPNAQGKRPAPVNAWCAKADYAESSSTHNTGMAKLTNDVLIRANQLTPAQKYVNSNHPYEVRTTIDGDPCYFFYRKTVNDKPKFLGKFNFNNDKSTEEVFGFLNVPGYHLTSDGSGPSQWIIDKFNGVNPTECWEFKSNDTPMGSYLDDDFDTMVNGTPNWMNTFESRYPDNNDSYLDGVKKPTYLKRIVSWVKSTLNNPTKFKTELHDYFDVNYLCDYFAFTQIMGAIDQMKKNSMLGIWYNPDVDKMLGYYIFYDNDTILGVRNDGRLKYHWDMDRQTIDPELGTYAYMAHDSVLWNNLESQFADEIKAAYVRLRAQMTNDTIFRIFDEEQAGRFSDRIYNLDAQYKYIEPRTMGVSIITGGVEVNTKYSYLESSQGSRTPHRRWWLTNRLDLFDARYGTGQYSLTDITWKGISAANASVSVKMMRDYYVEFKRESSTFAQQKVLKDATWSYTYPSAANIGTIFHLLGGKFFEELDFSQWGGFTDLSLPTLVNLRKLMLGADNKINSLSELIISNKLPMLEHLDVRNYSTLAALELDRCNRLQSLNARGCTNMGLITFAKGAPITSLVLPQSLNSLSLIGLPYLTNNGIQFPDGQRISALTVDSSPNIDWETLFLTLGNLRYLRITNIDKKGTVAWLNKYKTIGGVDENGNYTNTSGLSGTYQLTNYVEEPEYSQLISHFPNLDIKQPEFTTIVFDETVSDPANVTNLDNNTGYAYGVPYQPSGHINKILNARFGLLGKQPDKDTLVYYPLHNSNWNYYADAVNLNQATGADIKTGAEGEVYIYEPKYWYKGVNDFIADKKYSCFSFNINAPSYPQEHSYVRVTPNEFMNESGLNPNIQVRMGFSLNNTGTDIFSSLLSVSSSIRNDRGVASIEIPNESKLVAFPTYFLQDQICAMFTNNDGEIIQKLDLYTPIHKHGVGQKIIANIPENADKLHFVFVKHATFEDVIFTTSTDPLDTEPDWVFHEEVAMGAFQTVWARDNTLKTVAPDAIFSDIYNTYESMNTYLSLRHQHSVTYETKKDVINLFLAKYGNRDSKRVCGGGTTELIVGRTAFLGMTDTVYYSDNGNMYVTNPSYFDSITNTYKTLNSPAKCMGYEGLYYANRECCGGYTMPIGQRPLSSTNGRVAYITRNNNQLRKLKANSYSNYNSSVVSIIHGKYMDVFDSGMNSAGSDLNYYTDTQTHLTTDDTAMSIGELRTNGSFSTRGLFNISEFDKSLQRMLSARIQFTGTFVKATSIEQYKNVVPFNPPTI